MKKNKRNPNLLPIGILQMPDPVDTFAFNNIQNEIDYIDDERIAIKKNKTSIFFTLLCFAGILIGIPFLFSLSIGPIWLSIILGLLLLSALLFIVISEYADATDKYPYECEFNRKDGTITYSKFERFNPKRELRTFPFSNCDFEATQTYTREQSTHILNISNYSLNDFFRLSLYCEKKGATHETMKELFETHSFLQWYMDKNRPLPPGKVFDEYRLRDYETRKSRGLNKPLIASLVEMFEYNGEPCVEDEENNVQLKEKLISLLD